ncbi:MAG: hypothetical protein PUC23_02780 [bacterium]|nr:hypothetical protein [bacterium]
MKLIEYSKLLNLEYIVLVRFGNFYKCFDNDALILGYLLDYRIRENCVAFPVDSIGKVLLALKQKNISLILVKDKENIINYEVVRNNYDIILEQAGEYLDYNNKMVDLNNNIKILLKQDINNYEKIKKYLVNFN